MHTMLYRGSLKSCNYCCSYCPFSKHGMTDRELRRDREQWFSFLGSYKEQAEKQKIHALMLAPYGEALIHGWYWEGLAQVSVFPWTDAVGAQTNLGFPIAESMRIFAENGGMFSKLRLWATFHPEMTTVQTFVKSCRQLLEAGASISAGAVGVPEYAGMLQQLRKALPQDVYLWINRMDGMGRTYTAEEIQVFSDIDPYFYRELQPHPADVSQCRGRYFAEGDGRLRLCNISPPLETGWKEKEGSAFSRKEEESGQYPKACSRKRCSCYLAYGGQENLVNQMLFGPWPLFRIPRRPRAVFLDIEGTLLPPKVQKGRTYAKGQLDSRGCRDSCEHMQTDSRGCRDSCEHMQTDSRECRDSCEHMQTDRWKVRDISADIQSALEVLAEREKTLLFFATTLPYEDARKRCRSIWHLFSGGIFAGGAHVSFSLTGGMAVFYFLDEEIVRHLENFSRKLYARMLVYRNAEGRVYKITLLHTHQRPWTRQEADKILADLPGMARGQVRCLLEGCCMQIIAAEAGKAAGVRMICDRLRIPLNEIFAAGDSEEDAEMIQLNK